MLQALREAHDQFKASLSAAEQDFNQLAQLDKQIKSFNVGPNPYTWFTMEALEDTWRNLQKIIRVRISVHSEQVIYGSNIVLNATDVPFYIFSLRPPTTLCNARHLFVF